MAVYDTDGFRNLSCKSSTGEEVSVAAPAHTIVTTHDADLGPAGCQDLDYCSVNRAVELRFPVKA